MFVFLTFLPTLELRASIPYGILVLELPWWQVFLMAVILNFIFGVALYQFLDFFVKLFTKVPFIKEIYNGLVERTQRKVEPFVEKYGTIGIALFIAVPLPGSGVWTGALAAYLLGMKHRKFALAALIGVILAGLVVTVVSLGLLNSFA